MRCRLLVNVPMQATSTSLAPESKPRLSPDKIRIGGEHLPMISASRGFTSSQHFVQGRSWGWEKWPVTALFNSRKSEFPVISADSFLKRPKAKAYRVPQAFSSSWTSWDDDLERSPRELPHRYVHLFSGKV